MASTDPGCPPAAPDSRANRAVEAHRPGLERAAPTPPECQLQALHAVLNDGISLASPLPPEHPQKFCQRKLDAPADPTPGLMRVTRLEVSGLRTAEAEQTVRCVFGHLFVEDQACRRVNPIRLRSRPFDLPVEHKLRSENEQVMRRTIEHHVLGPAHFACDIDRE